MNQDILTFTGDQIKSLGDGRVGGYLVRFTDASKKDMSGEYFTGKTYFGAREGDGSDCLFHHSLPIKGVDAALTDHLFGPLKTRKDEIGVFAETVLNMADDYEKKVFELVEAGKLGWSSGAAAHTVRKSADGEILRWPIAEGSLTPTPCESQNCGGVRPLKSITPAELKSLGIKDVMTTGSGFAPPNPRPDGGTSMQCPQCHLWAHFDTDHRECPYCGATLSADDALPAGKSFSDQLDSALAAVESVTERARGLHQIRVKSDRTLSDGTRAKIQEVSEALADLLAMITPEDLEALEAEQTVVNMAVFEAQIAARNAERTMLLLDCY